MASYSKNLYATVLRACTSAVDSLDFDRSSALEQKWIMMVRTPPSRVRWRNEVLELLGDGVMNACITAQICESVQGSPSMLSILKSVLTSNIVFASITKRMINSLSFPLDKLRGFLDIPEHGTIPTKSFADAFETMIGALYKDKGFLLVEAITSRLFQSLLVSATKAYHSFRNQCSLNQSGESGSSSKKRKQMDEADEMKPNKRPKFMFKASSMSVPVIVDAGSGSNASLVQDLASVLEKHLQRTYVRHRDQYLMDVIHAISRESRRYNGSGFHGKASINRKLFHHGRKYIRMILAINDCADDYPDTDEDHGTEEHIIESTSFELSQATIIDRPCDTTPVSRSDELRDKDLPMLDTSMDLDIMEIELIDLVDDSDESDQQSLFIDEEVQTDDEETDTDDTRVLGRKSEKIVGKQTPLEVIDLLSSSDGE